MLSNLSQIKLNSEFIWKFYIFCCSIIIICCSTNEALAATPGPDTFGDALCTVVKVLSNNTAKAIATVAIFVLGLGFIGGKLQWQSVAIASTGIITIFSAGQLVKFLSGNTTGAGSCSV
jgi:type IV secretory pathway VirB2 component (pilin)